MTIKVMEEVSTLGEVRTTNEVRTLEDVDIILGNPSLMSQPHHMARGGRRSFCLTRQLMKLATKSLLRSPNESMVPGSNFRNHDLADPFKVVIHRVSPPFIDSELGRQFESGGDLGSHHPFSERRLNLFNQGIRDYRSACSGVNGVDTGVQVPDLLSGRFILVFGHLIIPRKSSFLFGDGDLEFAVAEPDLYYGVFRTPCHPIGWSGMVVGLLE
ncbi:hypothetical protein Acr_10g0009920 [Actinidia rufa]|uniref:Uncharacterized protein n=1 Tax=Actinidia rufa TaxID=165716 RepID=A0A7J0FCI8_9ERIC|nr:hypothetical protein Acr_10g0009920 [Actinidia rufa]